MNKKAYIKPEQRIIVLQHQQHILVGSNEVQSLRGGYFDYGGGDEAYQRSMVSFATQNIAEKDEERDQWGQVIEQVAKQWMRMPDAALVIDPSTDRIVSLAAKAKKVGGLYLALGGVAVRPTDSVDAKKEYALVAVSDGDVS